jgi:hypothetical protein
MGETTKLDFREVLPFLPPFIDCGEDSFRLVLTTGENGDYLAYYDNTDTRSDGATLAFACDPDPAEALLALYGQMCAAGLIDVNGHPME